MVLIEDTVKALVNVGRKLVKQMLVIHLLLNCYFLPLLSFTLLSLPLPSMFLQHSSSHLPLNCYFFTICTSCG